jgi:aldehyde:ferredoxin oxidoreductase
MNGWQGKVLRVDLSTKKIKSEPLDFDIAKKYVGGRGLGIYYLNKELDPKCDPLSPENILVMATGPLTGTTTPTGGRYMVTTKSPLTGAITCANSGGKFPKALKKTGFDVLIIKGQSDKPVYLNIVGDNAELKSADHLWGKQVPETTDLLLAETDTKAKVACIGPAGEKLVKFAAIMNDKDRAAGRGGVGTVMGAKRLKAIVVNGDKEVSIAKPAEYKEFHKKVMDKFKAAAKAHPSPLALHGTLGVMVPLTQKHGVLPTKNYQEGTFDHWEAISGQTLTEKYLVKRSACSACPIACGRVTKITDTGFEGEGEGPEFESGFALGPMCMVGNLAAITKANYVCNDMGMDTMSMGVTIACAMELYEKGIIDDQTTGGPINWGDPEKLVELTTLTGTRDGFGDLLAEGSYLMAEKFGHPELAMVSKKMELPGYDPRGLQAQGLSYATSPIGASHCRAHMAYTEMAGIPVLTDRHTIEGKAALTKRWQDMFTLIDATGLCIMFCIRNMFTQDTELRPENMLVYLNNVTGAEYTLEELELAGERIFNAERVFITNAGLNSKDDTLPKRMTSEPSTMGGSEGCVSHLDQMLGEYYNSRGWSEDGIPTAAKLEALKIE